MTSPADLIPSDDLLKKHRIGLGDFEKMGDLFLERFQRMGNVVPSSNVLDIGCGLGRLAFGLRKFLDEDGEYHGLDVNAEAIDWVNARWKDVPNFHFGSIDIQNYWYNEDGGTHGSKYRFDFDDGYFDFIFLTSVFSHVFKDVHENYLAEIQRLLRPGGRALMTYYVINDFTIEALNNGSKPDIVPMRPLAEPDLYTSNMKNPEACIGFAESYLQDQWRANNLNVVDEVHYGSWTGRKNTEAYQDIVIVER